MKITIKLTAKEKKLWSQWKPIASLKSDWYGVDGLGVFGDRFDGDVGCAFGVSFLKELKKQIDKIGEISKELDK